MELKTFLTLAGIQALVLAFQGILYLVVQYFQGPFHDMARPIDDKIPYKPQAVFFYVSWYLLIALYPIYLYSINSADYKAYLVTVVLDIIISTLIYWRYPTSFQRPKAPTDTFSGKILGLVYLIDYRGLNCTPSMHCSMCFIVIMSAIGCSLMSVGVQLAIVILCCCIICSTLLTKQHVIIDVVTALPLAAICSIAGKIIGCIL